MMNVENATGVAIGSPRINAVNSTVYYGSNVQQVEATVERERVLSQSEFQNFIMIVNSYKAEDSWLRPFPWNPNVKFEQEDFYVPLSLDVYNRGGLEKKDVQADLGELFDPVTEGWDRENKVLVRGDGGQGKTTLCMKIAYCWAHRTPVINALSKDILVIFYKLRLLNTKDDLETVLFEFVHSRYNPKSGTKSKKSTREILHDLGRNVLVILDGYDETDEKGKEKVRRLVSGLHPNVFLTSSFLVTSRPTDEEEFLELFDKQFYIGQMTEERTKQLVSKFYKNDDLKISQFFQQFVNLDLTVLSSLTIFTLCWIRKEGAARNATDSNEIMFECTNILAKRCNMRDGFNLSDERIDLVLFRLEVLCALLDTPLVKDHKLRSTFRNDYLFVVNMGILKRSLNGDYEPIHKMFFDSLAQYYHKLLQTALEKCSSEEDMFQFFEQYIRPAGRASKKIALFFGKDTTQYEVHIEIVTNINLGRAHFVFSRRENRVTVSFKKGNPRTAYFPCVIRLPSVTHPRIYTIVGTVLEGLGDGNFLSNLCKAYVDYEKSGRLIEDEEERSGLTVFFKNDEDPRINNLQRAIVKSIRLAGSFKTPQGVVLGRTDLAIRSPGDRVGSSFRSLLLEEFGASHNLFRKNFSLTDHRQIPGFSYYTGWRSAVEYGYPEVPCTQGLTVFHIDWSSCFVFSSGGVLGNPTFFMSSTTFQEGSYVSPEAMKPGVLPSSGHAHLDRLEWLNLENKYKSLVKPEMVHSVFMDALPPLSSSEGTSVEAELQVLFDPVLEGEKRAETVLLIGDPGAGKSHICLKVVYEWANYKTSIWALPCRSILPVLVELKSLDGTADLEEELFRIVHDLYSPRRELKNETSTMNVLGKLGNQVLFILHGFHAADGRIREQVKQLLKNKQKGEPVGCFPVNQASFLVTTRPMSDTDLPFLFDKCFTIKDLTNNETERILSYLFYSWNKYIPGLITEHNMSYFLGMMLNWIQQYKNARVLPERRDNIYSCIRLMARGCNLTEEFDLSENEMGEILDLLGRMCAFQKYRPKELPINFLTFSAIQRSFVETMGVLKPSLSTHTDFSPEIFTHELVFEALARGYLRNYERKSSETFPWEQSEVITQLQLPFTLTVNLKEKLEQIRVGEGEMGKIFDSTAQQPESILVTGLVGSGKTRLCLEVDKWWRDGRFSHQLSLSVYVEMRSPFETDSLGEALFRLLEIRYSPNLENSELWTKEMLKVLGNKVIVILDGLDEADDDVQEQVKKFLRTKESSLFRDTTFLVTSRPTHDTDLPSLFAKHLIIENISIGNLEFCVDDSCYHILRKVFDDFGEHSLTPLFLQMLCWIIETRETGGLFELLDTTVSCTRLLARRCNSKEGFNLSQDEIDKVLHNFYKMWSAVESGEHTSQSGNLSVTPEMFGLRMGILKPVRKTENEEIWKPINAMFGNPLKEEYCKPIKTSSTSKRNFPFLRQCTENFEGLKRQFYPL